MLVNQEVILFEPEGKLTSAGPVHISELELLATQVRSDCVDGVVPFCAQDPKTVKLETVAFQHIQRC